MNGSYDLWYKEPYFSIGLKIFEEVLLLQETFMHYALAMWDSYEHLSRWPLQVSY